MGRLVKFFKIALVSIFENKSRSVLTMLGVTIGIGAVIMMVSIGKGAESLILYSVQSFGAKSIFIQPGGGTRGGPPSLTAIDKVKYKDYLALKKLDYIENVTPISAALTGVTYGNDNMVTTIVGTNEEYVTAINTGVSKGRFIDESDQTASLRVAVIGYKVADKFFGDQDPIGKTIKIKQKDFQVIGVMDVQGERFFQDFDKRIVIPLSTMKEQINGVDYLQSILVNSKGDIPTTIEDLRYFVRKRHDLYNPENDPNKDDFKVVSQVDAAESFKEISNVLTLFLVAIAGISLLVGGIGIMNIMLVSVSERTREIGLRKSIGATNKDIMLQFLIEAIVITVVAGLAGVVGGILFAYLASLIIVNFESQWQFIVAYDAVAVAFLVSCAIGLIFGLYPARNAAKLNPIEALRYE